MNPVLNGRVRMGASKTKNGDVYSHMRSLLIAGFIVNVSALEGYYK
jgi:hypothetical protein